MEKLVLLNVSVFMFVLKIGWFNQLWKDLQWNVLKRCVGINLVFKHYSPKFVHVVNKSLLAFTFTKIKLKLMPLTLKYFNWSKITIEKALHHKQKPRLFLSTAIII